MARDTRWRRLAGLVLVTWMLSGLGPCFAEQGVHHASASHPSPRAGVGCSPDASPSRVASSMGDPYPVAGVACYRCSGTGKCWTCSGTGKGADEHSCYVCSGTGKCWFCSGSGECRHAEGGGASQ